MYILFTVSFAYIVNLWGTDSAKPFNVCTALEGIGKLLALAIAMPFIKETNIFGNNNSSGIIIANNQTSKASHGNVYKAYAIIGGLIIVATILFTFILTAIKPTRASLEYNEEKITESHTPLGEGKPKCTIVLYYVAFFVYFFLVEIVIAGLLNFLYTIAVESPTKFSSQEASILNFVTQCVATISKIVTIGLLHFIAIKHFISILFLLATIFGIIMSVFALSSNAAMWGITLLFKFSAAPFYACGFAYANEYINITGVVAGLFEVGISLGLFASAWMTASILENYGSSAVLWEVTVAVMCQALIVVSVKITSRKQPDTQLSSERHPLFSKTEE